MKHKKTQKINGTKTFKSGANLAGQQNKCMTMAGKVVKNKKGAKLKGGKIKKIYFTATKKTFRC